MADDIEFVNGLIVKAPRDGAPDFVKASISIKVADMRAWLSQQQGEWINVDVKESKGGKWYAAVNAYKKEGAGSKPAPAQPDKGHSDATSGSFNDFEDDIPF